MATRARVPPDEWSCTGFGLPANRNPPDKPVRRYEVLPDHRQFPDGDEAWFGFAFHLDSAFPLSSPGWTVIWQLHGEPSTGSPPVSFLAQEGGLWIDGGWGRPDVADQMALHYEFELTELAADRWYSCVCQVVFDSMPGRARSRCGWTGSTGSAATRRRAGRTTPGRRS
jgi:hypothetical protein